MINDTNQVQEAGDNAQQIQAQIVNIVNQSGIDEKRAREIFSDMFAVAKRDFAIEAENKAYERVQKLEDRLMPKMYRIEGALENFADPSFQSFLAKANRTAICTDRESDYDLLSELLIHRIEKKDSRKDQIGLNKAVEIVDQITDEALDGLTVFFAIEHYNPIADTLDFGLSILDNFYKKMPLSNLPTDNRWLEELDILDAVRLSSLGTLKKLEEYWTEKYSGFVAVGIKKDGDSWSEVSDLLEKCGLSQNVLVDNVLLDGFALLPVIQEQNIDNLNRKLISIVDGSITQIPITKEQQQALHKIYSMYDKSEDLRNKVKDAFVKRVDSYEGIKTARAWWNSIPQAVSVTSVGRVLAHVNAKRCDPTLPDLN